MVNANGRYPSYDVDQLRDKLNKENIFLLKTLRSHWDQNILMEHLLEVKGTSVRFHFSSPKIISTGQVGANFTNDERLSLVIKRAKDFGRDGGGNDTHDYFGANFKFTELQAIIGLSQLKKLEKELKEELK